MPNQETLHRGRVGTGQEYIEMSSRDLPDPEVEGPTAPLIDRDHEITRATTRDASGAYNNIFIWSLTLSAGVSGLLFGYELVDYSE